MNPRRHPNVINLADVPPEPFSHGTRFAATARELGDAVGAQKLGACCYEVPPGKTTFPYHWHGAEEESLYVLEGTGTLRLGADTLAVGPGDYVAFPCGPDHAHQLTNTGAAPLRYLCFSTRADVEVVGYPDSGKIGTRAGTWLRRRHREANQVDYYDGERVDAE